MSSHKTWPRHRTGRSVSDSASNAKVHPTRSHPVRPYGPTLLDDGRLVAVVWSLDTTTGHTQPTRYALASAGGQFGTPAENGITAQTMKIASLGGQRVLAVYRRHDEPGLWASTATIDGDTWVTEESTRLWAGAMSGMDGAGDVGTELSALQFGYPSIVVLDGGLAAAVAFWCREDDVYGIRILRLNLA
jgi:hypothetical protein